MRIRFYGSVLNRWEAEDERGRVRTTQREIAYTEYDAETGEIVGVGSEDFSPEREKREIERKWVWTWDGLRLNRGDHRWFDCRGTVTIRKSERKEVKRYLQNKYKAADIQLRG